MQPIFSIIIPCYNQGHFLPDCLNSLTEQGFTHWEAIVVNDGSSDDTSELASKYVALDSRIKLIEQANGGLSSARNFGIKMSTGKRIIFLDADDFLYANCLLEISNAINVVDDNILIQYGYTYINEDKTQSLHTVLPNVQPQLIPHIFSTVLGPCHSICISRQLIAAAGYFDETLKSLEDWDYWLRVAKSGASVKGLPMPLVYYRYVKNSMSRNAFVMYDAYKKVSSRAPKKDARINIDCTSNQDYSFVSIAFLDDALLKVLGVAIMQGQIQAAVELFNKESSRAAATILPHEFESMCSYLSFRYWYSKEDLQFVFEKVYPNFQLFFKGISYPKALNKKSIFLIFKRHIFYRNRFRFGNFAGSVCNFILRIKYNSN